MLSGFGLLSTKPLMAVVNVGEAAVGDGEESPGREGFAGQLEDAFPGVGVSAVCAPLELELAAMEPEEAAEFLAAEGLDEPGGPAILRSLGPVCRRVTFFTVIKEEVRAWLVPEDCVAAQAAGAVHTDMERGFIKAEVIGWRDLVDCGSIAAARERGLLRLEGREYVVRDGDVLTVRFSPK
jgi:ribosome-binding ATPase YchF (GTP1/OBG family)